MSTETLAVLAEWWTGMAMHLWQSALFLLLLVLAVRVLRDAPSDVLCALYWTGIVKLLLPLPVLGAVSSVLLDRLAGGVVVTGGEAQPEWSQVAVWMYPRLLDPANAGQTGLPAGVWIGLTAVWLLGFCGFLFVLVRSIRAARGLRLLPMEELAVPLRDGLAEALQDNGLRKNDVRIALDARAPFVRGVLRPVVVIPLVLLEGLEPEELRAVLMHETSHVRRRDPLRYGVLAAIRAVFFFFPPVWWLVHRIRETTELACDEAVLRAGFPPTTYRRSLARALNLGLAPGVAVAPLGVLGHSVSFLSYRLERLRSARRLKTMMSHRLILASAALLALAVSFLPVAPSFSSQAAVNKALPGSGDLTGLRDAELPMRFNFEQASVSKVLETIEKASGVTIEGSIPDRSISVDLADLSLVEALTIVGQLGGLRYEVLGPARLWVRPVRVAGTDGVSNPRLIPEFRVDPEYPDDARRNRMNGTVVLQAVINRSGYVEDVQVLRAEPKDYQFFKDAAVEAVSQWRYEPSTLDGEPVDVYFTIVIEFNLRNGSGDDDKESGPTI